MKPSSNLTMFNKRNTYIIIAIIIGFLMAVLLGLGLFLSKEEKKNLEYDTSTDYLLNETSARDGEGFKSGGSIFGKIIEEIKNTPDEYEEKDIEFKANIQQLHIAPIVDSAVGVDGSVHFVESSTGHAFKLTVGDKIETKRVLHTTVPEVREAIWFGGGTGVIRRYVDDKGNIASAYSIFTALDDEAQSGYLTDNITVLDISPSGEQLFYIVVSDVGAKGYLSTISGTDQQLIWESWVRQWNVKWVDETHILVTQKPSDGEGGASFLLNADSTNEELVISRVPGLITNMSNDGNMLVYSDAKDGSVSLYIMDLLEHKSKVIPLSTFANKCAWSNVDTKTLYCFTPKTLPSASYPDVWYQGIVHFTDDLWKINIETGELELILNLKKEFNTEIDAENILISQDDMYIYVTNKTDQTLWAIKIKEDSDEEDKAKEEDEEQKETNQ